MSIDYHAQPEHESYLTCKEAGGVLRVRDTTIQEFIRTGKLKAIRVGRGYRIANSDLKEFIMQNTVG